MKSRIPLNQLGTFAAAAQRLSFQAAANQLHVTPSAVSHQIRHLESVLGYRLFERIDKGVRLSPRGQALFDRIRSPLAQLQEAAEAAMRPEDNGALLVSVAPIFATRWLLPRLGSFRRANPDIALSIIATTDVLDFQADNIDCAIRIGPGQWRHADTELLFRPAFAAVCTPDLVEANGGPFSVSELCSMKRVGNLALPDLWRTWFAAAGVKAPTQEPVLQVQNSAQVVEALQADRCIGLLDLNLLGSDIDNGRIALACPFLFEEGDGYYFVSSSEREVPVAQAKLATWLREQVRSRPDLLTPAQ